MQSEQSLHGTSTMRYASSDGISPCIGSVLIPDAYQAIQVLPLCILGQSQTHFCCDNRLHRHRYLTYRIPMPFK